MWGMGKNFWLEDHCLASRGFAKWCQNVTWETEISVFTEQLDRYFFMHIIIYLFTFFMW